MVCYYLKDWNRVLTSTPTPFLYFKDLAGLGFNQVHI